MGHRASGVAEVSVDVSRSRLEALRLAFEMPARRRPVMRRAGSLIAVRFSRLGGAFPPSGQP